MLRLSLLILIISHVINSLSLSQIRRGQIRVNLSVFFFYIYVHLNRQIYRSVQIQMVYFHITETCHCHRNLNFFALVAAEIGPCCKNVKQLTCNLNCKTYFTLLSHYISTWKQTQTNWTPPIFRNRRVCCLGFPRFRGFQTRVWLAATIDSSIEAQFRN